MLKANRKDAVIRKGFPVKKALRAVVCVLWFAQPVFAGPFDSMDTDAQKAATFIEDYLGEAWKAKVMAEYPGAQIKFGARPTLGGGGETTSTYVVYAELKQPNREDVYYYFEIAITNLNANPEIAKKYGIQT